VAISLAALLARHLKLLFSFVSHWTRRQHRRTSGWTGHVRRCKCQQVGQLTLWALDATMTSALHAANLCFLCVYPSAAWTATLVNHAFAEGRLA